MPSSRSFFNFGLQSSALRGDYQGVQRALQAGANVNLFDASGRGVVMCAIAGEHWNDIESSAVMTPNRVKILETLLGYVAQSLYAFNAPQPGFNGVTPLGMAAWLNSTVAVQLLLDSSSGVVDVDGMDSHGATPLMYAARDENLEIVHLLLKHGARPDFRDKNHRSSVQYALSHPTVLHTCESLLRHYRQHEGQPCPLASGPDTFPSNLSGDELLKATTSLLKSVVSSDLSLLHSLLSPSSSHPLTPILINQPDSHGWSAIHHCCSARELSKEILDSLYCAGADVSLFTSKEHYTPLHCLAFSSSADVYDFAIHLICDLRAPLSAVDKQGATCIHAAAEHGTSLELLKAFLERDTTGRIREVRDNNGMTALELAKPEFREAFGLAAEDLRPQSALSVSTIRPRLHSFPSLDHALQHAKHDDESQSLSDFDVVTAAHQLIDNLRITSPSIQHDRDPTHLAHIETLLLETTHLSSVIISHFRSRSEGASRSLLELNGESSEVDDLLSVVGRIADEKLISLGMGDLIRGRRCHRESEDSQLTAVSTPVTEHLPEPHVEQSKEIPETAAKVEDSVKTKETSIPTSSFFKGWFKRKTPKGKENQTATSPVDSPSSPRPEGQAYSEAQSWLVQSADATLRASPSVFDAAEHELSGIKESLLSASQLIESTNRSISRAERVIAKAVKKRKCMLADLRTHSKTQEKDLFIRPKNGSPHSFDLNLSSKSSLTSLYSISSVNSELETSENPQSFAAILAENDDEETKAIRRLILRKIEARTDGALDEVEKAIPRLRVVRETIRGVKRRASLDVSRTLQSR
ncbi:hypothetical protein V5O48_004022 [Marasmius crinis-equi]|uniref:Ankyrin n=1 Tax=Marasmius crinis-equi TaxID=585013 RepID=A0ABR3FRA6_9AGAR